MPGVRGDGRPGGVTLATVRMKGRLGTTELVVALRLLRRGRVRELLRSLRRRRWWFARRLTRRVTLAAYRQSIERYNAAQPNRQLLDEIRAYNHTMIEHLNAVHPVEGMTVLDLGASPHGYALERALERGVRHYIGVGLDIRGITHVVDDHGNSGMLLKDDATALRFPTAMFDLALSISCFEHFTDVDAVLVELARVLKPEGRALLTLEPVWSCSYGHHLHHFGDCAKLVPPWAHLTWAADEMRRSLQERWPGDAPLSLDAAVEWVYSGGALNRLTVRDFVERFQKCPLAIEWVVKSKENPVDLATVERVSRVTGMAVDELVTTGLSVLLKKAA